MQRKTMLAWPVVCALMVAGCSGTPQTALSPSGIDPGEASLNPDGSTMKVSAPRDLKPTGEEAVDSRRPTLTFTNAVGLVVQINVAHEIEIQDANGNVVYSRVVGETASSTSHTVEIDLPLGGTFWWRGRGRFADQFGPWSGYATFRTPAPSAHRKSGANLPRTPDPPRLAVALPNMRHVVRQSRASTRAQLLNSCQESWGTGTSCTSWSIRCGRSTIGGGTTGSEAGSGIRPRMSLTITTARGQAKIRPTCTSSTLSAAIAGARPAPDSGSTSREVTPQGGGIGRWTGLGRFTN